MFYNLTIAMLSLTVIWMPTSCHGACVCKQIPGAMVQIDAGRGQVFGVNRGHEIFTRSGSSWLQLPGKLLEHVTVGPAGVWGVSGKYNIFKLVAGDWVLVPGRLYQIDAGGDKFVAGVSDLGNNPVCLSENYTMGFQPLCNAKWTPISGDQDIPGHLKYYSCGPVSCWGVSHQNNIYIRKRVTPHACEGGDWQKISGPIMLMIEVGEDGSVYAVSNENRIYRRTGISTDQPEGQDWIDIDLFRGQWVNHVSYDLGHLWVILHNDEIYECTE